MRRSIGFLALLLSTKLLCIASLPAAAAPRPSVSTRWTARYGATAAIDSAYAMALDRVGNIYVTGGSTGVATGGSTDLFSGLDYATVKYDADGKQLWVARYNGPGNDEDTARAIALDSSGDVFVTGYSKGDGTDYDIATAKYDPSGKELWVARYNGPGNGIDLGLGLVLDASGNAYVVGSSYRASTKGDYTLLKYDFSGKLMWTARYNGPGNDEDMPTGIALDSAGNIYVTGASQGSGSDDDYATVKYTPSGKRIWVARYNGSANYIDVASDIALDGAGNVYVTGGSYETGTDRDYTTVKYDANGKKRWVAHYDGGGGLEDGAGALSLDGAGNVYVTGYSSTVATKHDYLTLKYDSGGKQLWAARYDGPISQWDEPNAIAVDSKGNVYVTGQSYGKGPEYDEYDYATLAYDTNGKRLWQARYQGTGGAVDRAFAVCVDGSGNIYVTGESVGEGPFYDNNYDYITIRYSSTSGGTSRLPTSASPVQ